MIQRIIFPVQPQPSTQKKMGHDFDGLDTDGNLVISISRMCSGNLRDMFDKYHVSPTIWHGHSSDVLLHNINQAIVAVRKDNAMFVQPSGNNFFWGIDRDEEPMEGLARLNMFYTWLRYWRNVVEEFPNLRWYSDQVWEITPYDDLESDGEQRQDDDDE